MCCVVVGVPAWFACCVIDEHTRFAYGPICSRKVRVLAFEGNDCSIFFRYNADTL